MVPDLEDLLLDEPAQESHPDIRQVLLFGIGRFRYWIILFVMLGGLGGLAAALMQPNQFSSEVKVLVRPGYRMLRSPEAMLDPARATIHNGTAVEDEVHLLNNPELSRRVVQRVGAHIVLQPYDPQSMDDDSTPWLTRRFHKLQASWASRSTGSIAKDNSLAQRAAAETVVENLRLLTARDTDVITIYYRAHSPEIARTVAEAFLEVALERHGEVFASEAGREMVTKKYDQALRRLDEANKAFRDHREQCGIVDFEMQREEAVRLIQQEQAFIEQDRHQLESIKGGMEFLDEQLASLNSEVDVDQPTVTVWQPNPEYVQQRQTLSDLQNQRSMLSGQYVPGSDLYRSEFEFLTARIEESQEVLEDLEEWAPLDAAENGAANPVYSQTVAARLAQEQRQRSLLSGMEIRRQSLIRYEAQLDDVMSCELVHRIHLNAIARAEQEVGTLATVYTREKDLASIDQSASLMVIQPATLPTEKDGPEHLQTLLAGVALGLFAGMAFATLRQLAESKMRYPVEVETFLDIPVLGLIPESRDWRRLGRQLDRQLKETSPGPT